MQAILRRLEKSGDFDIIVFPEETIHREPIEQWPKCECLIAFHSKGFPLEKCRAYVNLVQPIVMNDIADQVTLMNRLSVYQRLQEWGIPCPDYIAIDHTCEETAGDFMEHDNYIVYKGKQMNKPFVEKPLDADNHEIWIHYPRSLGGGAKKLFRKIQDRASLFDPQQNSVRNDGVYLYEPFFATGGTDIKVYTVGMDYVHAEARKAPTVDGKVQRSQDGKEIRYPIILSESEKVISALITQAFRQMICGFDILRTKYGSIVCDVNGWSFVKGNQKYYNDVGILIRKHFLETSDVNYDPTIDPLMYMGPGEEIIQKTFAELNEASTPLVAPVGCCEQLRCVLVVMRHGDRRPKEKLKFKTVDPNLLAYFSPGEESEVRISTPEEMRTLSARVNKALTGVHESGAAVAGTTSRDGEKYRAKDIQNLEQLKGVLALEERFSGLERKVQLRPTSKEIGDDGRSRVSEVLVVAKWGGELTVQGLEQAEDLGRRLRLGLFTNDPTGLLRLHSSFRHDFKIYSSQEGRCQITAAAFTKGFLDLDGDLTPILVSLVQSDQLAQKLLDEPLPKKLRDDVKHRLEDILVSQEDLGSVAALQRSCPTGQEGLRQALTIVGRPLEKLHTLRDMASEYIGRISDDVKLISQQLQQEKGSNSVEVVVQDRAHNFVTLGSGLSGPADLKDPTMRRWIYLRRIEHRWLKLINDFREAPKKSGEDGGGKKEKASDGKKPKDNKLAAEKSMYDMSKIAVFWDNIYYDLLHHRQDLGSNTLKIAEDLIAFLQPLYCWVTCSEFGIESAEKFNIGVELTRRLIPKLMADLSFMLDEDCVSDDDTPTLARHPLYGPLSPISDSSVGSPQAPGDVLLRIGSPTRRLRGKLMSIKDNISNSPKLAPTTDDDMPRPMGCFNKDVQSYPKLREPMQNGSSPFDKVRSRIYCTSASTMHSLLNVLRHGDVVPGVSSIIANQLADITDVGYLSHIVLRCYEREPVEGADPSADVQPMTSDGMEAVSDRYRVEILVSPGAHVVDADHNVVQWPSGSSFHVDHVSVAPLQVMAASCSLRKLQRFFCELTCNSESVNDNGTDEETNDLPQSVERLSWKAPSGFPEIGSAFNNLERQTSATLSNAGKSVKGAASD